MIWDDVIPESDLKVLSKSGYGQGRAPGKRPALIIVDLSYGFVDSSCPRGHSETGWPAVKANQVLLEAARKKDIPIIFTTGYPQGVELGFANKQSVGSRSDREVEIVEELAPRPGEVLLRKRRPSGFFNTNMVDMLIHQGVDTTIITGMSTSGCVRATVIDAFSYNYKVIVPVECTADRASVPHKVNLFDMHMKYALVWPLAEVLSYLEQL